MFLSFAAPEFESDNLTNFFLSKLCVTHLPILKSLSNRESTIESILSLACRVSSTFFHVLPGFALVI